MFSIMRSDVLESDNRTDSGSREMFDGAASCVENVKNAPLDPG